MEQFLVKGGHVGKIVSYLFMSLDGVVESSDQWHFPYFNDEMGQRSAGPPIFTRPS